jgi:predicted RNase H-like HicB family nuclease
MRFKRNRMKNYIKTDLNQNIIELQLSILVFQEGEYYVAFCPSLNLSSYGDSIDDAKEGFDEVVMEYICEANKNKSLAPDLSGLGWQVRSHEEAKPPGQVELNIPAGLLKSQFNQSYRVPAC